MAGSSNTLVSSSCKECKNNVNGGKRENFNGTIVCCEQYNYCSVAPDIEPVVIDKKQSTFARAMCEFFTALTRKKQTDGGDSPLARVINLADLITLGVGGTLGIGVYVLAGSVAKTVAGPAVCISFLIAAIASAFAGVCYAEFSARVPKAGSAYIYSYVSVGEFVAFVIGWNLILEYVIGAASVASGMTNYIDVLIDKQIRNSLQEWIPLNVSFFSAYPDLLSFVFIMILTGFLSFGVRESLVLNHIFTTVNLATILIAIIAGSIKADVSNWKIDPSKLNPIQQAQAGSGGFLPFGVSGVMAGAAKCFYGFIGFDAVATTSEEAKNPQKDIPLAIVASIFMVCGVYFVISTILTMALPFYLQDADAPFPFLFEQLGWNTLKWIITIGAFFALCTSLLGNLFPLPRIMYAMASDGIIFKSLSKVNKKTKTPIVATVVAGILSGIVSIFFDLEQLIDMMSIGTLMAYTIVAISLLLLRYEPNNESDYLEMVEGTTQNILEIKQTEYTKVKNDRSKFRISKNIFNLHNIKYPTKQSSNIVKWSITLFSIFSGLFCATIANGGMLIFFEPFYLGAFVTAVFSMLLLLVVILRQPPSETKLSFKVPLVPYIPCISVVLNLYLMSELSFQTWIRFSIWLAIGLIVYFVYGIRHSEERKCNKEAKEMTKTRLLAQNSESGNFMNVGS